MPTNRHAICMYYMYLIHQNCNVKLVQYINISNLFQIYKLAEYHIIGNKVSQCIYVTYVRAANVIAIYLATYSAGLRDDHFNQTHIANNTESFQRHSTASTRNLLNI